MKIVFTIVFIFLYTLLSFAQDKKTDAPKKDEYKISTTIKTVRSYLKDGKNSNANSEVEKAFKDHPETRSSAQLYALNAQALHNLVLDENKKMYLKQKPDTTKYFSYIYSLYQSALTCDSLEQLPDEKGRINQKYRNTNRERLLQFRKNLATADKYYYQKKDFKNAYSFADLYLSSKHSPLFVNSKGVNLLSEENDSVPHGSLAVFLAYAYNNYKGVTKYLPLALLDTTHLAQIYEVGANSYMALGDTLSANMLLYNGLNKYPKNEYFYMTLVKYYNNHSDYENAIKVIDRVLAVMPDDRNCLFLKAKEYEYLDQDDKAVETMNALVCKHQEDYEAFAFLGNMNLDMAHRAYRKFNLKVTDKNYQKGRQHINDFYSKARDAYEKCRHFAEKKPDLWLTGLRECYYKLNLGKELKSLDRIK